MQRDIFRNRYGDCKDKTTLLISMLQVAGIQAHICLWISTGAWSIPMHHPFSAIT